MSCHAVEEPDLLEVVATGLVGFTRQQDDRPTGLVPSRFKEASDSIAIRGRHREKLNTVAELRVACDNYRADHHLLFFKPQTDIQPGSHGHGHHGLDVATAQTQVRRVLNENGLVRQVEIGLHGDF